MWLTYAWFKIAVMVDTSTGTKNQYHTVSVAVIGPSQSSRSEKKNYPKKMVKISKKNPEY